MAGCARTPVISSRRWRTPDRAGDLSAELGDPELAAYLLMRKSNIATDMGDPAMALALADAAASRTADLPLKIRAVIWRQKANAHAGVGDLGPACDLAQRAIATVRQAASARTLHELARLAQQLMAWPTHPDTTAVRAAVASLTGSAR